MEELELKKELENEKKGNYILLSEWYGGRKSGYYGFIVNLNTLIVKEYKSSAVFENGKILSENEIQTVGSLTENGKDLLNEYIRGEQVFKFNKVSNLVFDEGTNVEIKFDDIKCELINCNKKYTNNKFNYYDLLLKILKNNIDIKNKNTSKQENNLNDITQKFNNLNKENPNEENKIFDKVINLNYMELVNLRSKKKEQCNKKINGIDLSDNEKNNPGFTFWTAKTIMENIKYIDLKIINKFATELDNNNLEKYKYEIKMLETAKYNNMSDINNILEKLI